MKYKTSAPKFACKLCLCVILFFSCTEQNLAPNIQDLANQWSIIENNPDITLINNFHESINQFQKSELYRIYNSIPFNLQAEHIPGPHTGLSIRDNIIRQAVDNLQQYIVIFRDSFIEGNLEAAQTASFEITSAINRLLSIDAEVQRFVSFAYFNLLMTLAMSIVILVLISTLLYKALARSLKREDDRIKFSHAYILAQEEERLRISRELHDTVIQDMRYLLLETEKTGTGSEKTVPMITDIMKKTRSVCKDLVPPDFRFSNLANAIRQLCLDMNERTGINCRADIEDNLNVDSLATEKRLQVYRIVKEALTNIEKHAQAKEAIVTMHYDSSQGIVRIGISDDGKGFASSLDNTDLLANNSSLGIISMKERAAILGGTLKIITEPGEGVLVCLEFPCY